MSSDILITGSSRVLPRSRPSPRVTPLSLLDATAANFALTSAIWLFDAPPKKPSVNVGEHLAKTLAHTLDAYPHWTGKLGAVTTTDGTVPDEAAHLPVHARRFGRIYARFGHDEDPGVSFTTASCASTLRDIYPDSRTSHAIWDVDKSRLGRFVSQDTIAHSLAMNEDNQKRVLLAIQLTGLACGGFVVAAKIAHPLADISALAVFMRHWAAASAASLRGDDFAPKPAFDSSILDALAGSINDPEPDAQILKVAADLPLHRNDWWASAATCPWEVDIPEPFRKDTLVPAGNIMPWSEWDTGAPVSRSIVHLTREQIDFLWSRANKHSTARVSRHDAVLAHIWSRVARARRTEPGPVHCDLVCGARNALQLGSEFIGSPTFMVNVEMDAAEVTSETGLDTIASRIREVIGLMARPSHVAAHLYSVAYEASPQRIWQAFLGRRHVLATSWVRSGVLDVDFGLGSLVYVDSVMPSMDGIVVIKEAPRGLLNGASGVRDGSWTEYGVDVDIHIEAEAMKRLLVDATLLPACG